LENSSWSWLVAFSRVPLFSLFLFLSLSFIFEYICFVSVVAEEENGGGERFLIVINSRCHNGRLFPSCPSRETE
jgi:hypothetical protein